MKASNDNERAPCPLVVDSIEELVVLSLRLDLAVSDLIDRDLVCVTFESAEVLELEAVEISAMFQAVVGLSLGNDSATPR